MDNTSIARRKAIPVKHAFHHKMKALALVDRDSGKARTMVVDNVAREAHVMTDEHFGYREMKRYCAAHSPLYTARACMRTSPTEPTTATLSGSISSP